MYKELFGNQKNIIPVQREFRSMTSRWKDALQYETYLPDLSKEYARNAMRQIFEPAKTSDILFDLEELSWLYAFAFGCCHNVRHNANGTIFISGNHDFIVTKFLDKLEGILPGCSQSPQIGGNFFITPTQYGLHNDSTRRTDWENSLSGVPEDSEFRRFTPWRNIIIPLWIAYPQVVSHGVWFEQRHLDFAHVYNHGKKIATPATTYPIVTDHSTIDFYNQVGELISKEKNLIKYDKEHHSNYLWHTPRERLTGLTPESTIEWEPGKPIIFDAVQLHATNPGTNINYTTLGPSYQSKPDVRLFEKTRAVEEKASGRIVENVLLGHEEWEIKMGLLLTFLKEIK